MAKINLPVDGTNVTPNVNNLTGEAKKYQALQMQFPRSSSGQTTFTASPSGIEYNTEDYPNNINIYNKGDEGMMNLLFDLYGGTNGWIVSADDINSIHTTITDNLTTQTTGTALDAHQGYVLDQGKLDKTGQAADSAMLGGVAPSGYQTKCGFYSNIVITAASWVDSSSFAGFPYEVTVTGNGISCKSTDFAIVVFDPNYANYIKLASVVTCGLNSITIFSSVCPTSQITIASLVILRS